MEDAFSLLHEDVRRLAAERFGTPTEIQSLAIPEILRGKSVLMISETGSGKTESVLLPVFDRLSSVEHRPISILYITPLRSLNRDIMKRIMWWAGKLDFEVSVRHSDTTQYERQMQSQNPTELLITTPETLQAILVGKKMKEHLRNVRFVIIDEIHELVASKRGSGLSVGLERLRELVKPAGFQTIGLSATIGNPETFREFIKADSILQAGKRKKIEISVVTPKRAGEDKESARKLFVDGQSFSRIRFIKEAIAKHPSILVFTNTRQTAEALSSRLKLLNAQVETHHSSLAKEVRISAEDDFKSQKLKALICTSSLELGIDIGSVDFVVQYGSPRQVSKLMQRVGRAGHSLDRVSAGCLLPVDPDDTFEACAIAKLALLGMAEDVRPFVKPLDVLAHQIAGLALDEWSIPFSKAYSILKRAYPFRELGEEEMFEVCLLLDKLGCISLLREGEAKEGSDGIVIRRRAKAFTFYNENLSTIRDSKTYKLIDSYSNKAVASLDSGFISMHVAPGVAIIVKGQGWRVLEIGQYTVTAEPLSSLTAAVPVWEGELIPVPYKVACAVGRLREAISAKAASGPDKAVSHLTASFPVDEESARSMARLASGKRLPTDSRIIMEYGVHDDEFFLIINCCAGSLANETIGRAIAALASDRLGSLGLQADPYRIIFKLRQLGDWKEIADTFTGLLPDSLEKILSLDLPEGELFAWHFTHIAKLFGVIAKDAEFGKGYLRKVIKAYRDTPLYRETLAELYHQKLDIAAAKDVLRKVKSGDIAVELNESLSAISIMGLERRYEIIGAEKPEKEIFEMFKQRLLGTNIGLVCCNCSAIRAMGPVKDVEADACKSCGSKLLAVTPFYYTREMQEIVKKNLQGKRLEGEEAGKMEKLLDSASLLAASGPDAIKVLAGRGIGPRTAARILSKMDKGDALLTAILDAERQYIKTRGFWKE